MTKTTEIMHKTFEAIIDKNGRIQVVEDMRVKKPVRALITILEEAPKPSLDSQMIKVTEMAYPLRGTSYQFDDPFSPVAAEEWNVEQ